MKILVVGLGITGVRCITWLKSMGADVMGTDIKDMEQIPQEHISTLVSLGVALETGKHEEKTFLNSDLIILSPGVPTDMDIIKRARGRGIPVMGEMELASRFIKAPIIAITGTNGKSTTTELISLILRKGGFRVFTGGNIGSPLVEHLIDNKPIDYAVIEVSSFQLETIETFSPYISIILNISPDHLERYRDFESYARTKLKIYMNQKPFTHLILNYDDQFLTEAPKKEGLNIYWFSTRSLKGVDAFLRNDGIIIIQSPENGEIRLDYGSLPVKGLHNAENVMASALSALIVGVSPEIITEALQEFRQLPHRLQLVATVNGVDFYNDSKATNIDSACKSIMSFNRPVILIAGGRHKGTGYEPLSDASKGRVKFAFLIGESRELIAKSFKGVVPFDFADTLRDAVWHAYSMADRGDVVLLAPACSSFDMFRDYIHRGEEFIRIVREISYEGGKAEISGI